MRKIITVTLAGAALALSACSEREAADAGNDIEAAAESVASEARDAVSSPEVKEVGSEIKEAAGDVGQVAKGAFEGAREAAADVEAEATDEPQDAKR